jgi:hypothetical protein
MFLSPVASKAAIQNFGGQIVYMIPCVCSLNLLLYVRDVRYGILPLVYQPGLTFLYKMYQPRPSVNSLGSYTPGTGVCLVYSGNSCESIPALGLMLRLGTSLSI